MIKVWSKVKTAVAQNLSKFTAGILSAAALLTFAGIFKGVGYIIKQYLHNEQAALWNNAFSDIGNIFFTLIAFMFVMSIVASFTKEAYAVFAGAIAWMALLLISSGFIIWEDGKPYSFGFMRIYQDIGSGKFGFKVMDPGIVWSFFIAAIVIKLWNKFHDIKFHRYFAFWEGQRFVPFIAVVAMVPTAAIYMLTWPGVGYAMFRFGDSISQAPAGLDSFAFYLINYLLLPFGFHHFFYSPFLYEAAGGQLTGLESFNVDFKDHNGIIWKAGTPIFLIFDNIRKLNEGFSSGGKITSELFAGGPISGDKSLMLALEANLQVKYELLKDHLQLPHDAAEYRTALEAVFNGTGPNADGAIAVAGDTAATGETFVNAIETNYKGTNTIPVDGYTYNAGKYLSGEAFITWFAAPGAVAAMILTAPKDKRKDVSALLIGGWISWFFGVSEPFIYTFLFTAPILYFGLLCPLLAASGLVGNVMELHYIGEKIIFFITTGVVPGILGQDTNFWWLWVIGPGFGVAGFLSYFFAIKGWNLKTPGREGAEIKFATKAEGKAALKARMGGKGKNTTIPKSELKKKVKGEVDPSDIIKALGGKSNIKAVNNCASRLRVDINDKSKVDLAAVKQTGAFGHLWVGTGHIQIIYGTTVQRIRQAVDKALK